MVRCRLDPPGDETGHDLMGDGVDASWLAPTARSHSWVGAMCVKLIAQEKTAAARH